MNYVTADAVSLICNATYTRCGGRDLPTGKVSFGCFHDLELESSLMGCMVTPHLSLVSKQIQLYCS